DYYALQAVFAGVQHGDRPVDAAEDERRRQQLARIGGRVAEIRGRLSRYERTADGLRPAVNAKTNEEHFKQRPVRFVRFTVLATNSQSEPCLDELEIWSAARPDAPPRNVALAESGARATSSGDYMGNPKHRLSHLIDGRY